jgi:protein-disulfide isomerase
MHDRLFDHVAYLGADAIRLHAEDLGLDLGLFDRDLTNPDVTSRVERDMATGRASGVRGTPTFFLDGVRYVDSSNLKGLEDAILRAADQ